MNRALALLAAALLLIAGQSACGGHSPKPVRASGTSVWGVQLDAPDLSALRGLAFADTLHGWIAGWSGVSGTTDGGASWTPEPLPSQAVGAVGHIAAVDATHAWATCEGAPPGIIHTVDGGLHWQFIGVDR
jgi:photosystem II stability/assembly factor-like uncharacterized protein